MRGSVVGDSYRPSPDLVRLSDLDPNEWVKNTHDLYFYPCPSLEKNQVSSCFP